MKLLANVFLLSFFTIMLFNVEQAQAKQQKGECTIFGKKGSPKNVFYEKFQLTKMACKKKMNKFVKSYNPSVMVHAYHKPTKTSWKKSGSNTKGNCYVYGKKGSSKNIFHKTFQLKKGACKKKMDKYSKSYSKSVTVYAYHEPTKKVWNTKGRKK
jgi:hypothetical protein